MRSRYWLRHVIDETARSTRDNAELQTLATQGDFRAMGIAAYLGSYETHHCVSSARYRTCRVLTVARDHGFDHLSAPVAQGSSLRESSEIDLTRRMINDQDSPSRSSSFSSVCPLILAPNYRESAGPNQFKLLKGRVGSFRQEVPEAPSAHATKFGCGRGVHLSSRHYPAA